MREDRGLFIHSAFLAPDPLKCNAPNALANGRPDPAIFDNRQRLFIDETLLQ